MEALNRQLVTEGKRDPRVGAGSTADLLKAGPATGTLYLPTEGLSSASFESSMPQVPVGEFVVLSAALKTFGVAARNARTPSTCKKGPEFMGQPRSYVWRRVSHHFSISSNVLPLVSGTFFHTKRKAVMETTP